MKLSIIVNHYRTPEILKICLRSIKKDLEKSNFDWEIIITDSATIEKTIDIIQENFPDVLSSTLLLLFRLLTVFHERLYFFAK